MTEFMIGALAGGKIPQGDASSISALPEPKELQFELDEKANQDIQTAQHNFNELIGNHELEVLQYGGLGKNACKTHKVSPDATAQIIKQLAFHKLNGRPGISIASQAWLSTHIQLGVCYESAQTRKFALGRTEVIRAASSESKAFAEAMLDAERTNEERMALFKKAVNRHLQYAAWAADGQGVDRHLFGLKRLLKEGEVRFSFAQ
jgi:carnitine O-acetyltransferase